MKKILQNIIFPTDNKLKSNWGLFYRGVRCVINDNNEMLLFKNKHVDFATYLNGFPLNKWRKYTNLKNITLHLDIKGKFEFFAIGYHLEPIFLHEHFHSDYYTFEEKTTLTFTYPEDNQEEMLTFELHALEDCVVYGGYFTAEFEMPDIREIELAVATTTCKKEEYITHNISLIKKEIIESQEEISKHFHLHVIDNGRTLDYEGLCSDRIMVYPNKNVGGAGGFARGMIEASRQSPKATHVLLMDDDVVVLPESIKRTYMLLTVLKEEFYDSFISGAMLELEEMFTQHEDIGHVEDDGAIHSLKGRQDQVQLHSVLHTNLSWFSDENNISAWWYCCIPMSVIEKNNLPLPVFIRGDDMEYSLRCKANILSMTGICVWHMSFNGRYSPSLLIYQQFRNLLIMQAVSGVIADVDIFGRLKLIYRQMLLEFSYDGAELALDALEDYMKGPEFIKNNQVGEEVFVRNAKLSEKMIPLKEMSILYPKVDLSLHHVYDNHPITISKRLLYRLSFNGHRFIPEKWMKVAPVTIGYDMSYQPNKQALLRQLIAVNVSNQTGCLRTIDKKRFRLLQARYKKLVSIYKKNSKNIQESYRSAAAQLTSQEFWERYLELEES